MGESKEGEPASSKPLIPPPLPSSSSPSSASSEESSSNKKEEQAVVPSEHITAEAADGRCDRDGDRDDAEAADGYRTPTSPEHRIPVPLECPPAPRKPPPSSSSSRRRRRSERRMRSGQAGGGEVKEAAAYFDDGSSDLEVEEFSPAAKKARKKAIGGFAE